MKKPLLTPYHNKSQLIAFMALLIAASAILSYIEILVPIPIPIPGIKLGLSNVVLLFALYHLKLPQVYLILVSRIFILFLITGNFMALAISLSGGGLAILIMFLFRIISFDKLSIITISILGALAHNLGQLLMVSYLYASPMLIISYYPILAIAGIITGFLIGFIYLKFSKYFNILLPK